MGAVATKAVTMVYQWRSKFMLTSYVMGAGMSASEVSALLKGDAEAAPVAPFVGRERERRLLAGLIDSVDGGGAAALILGEPGMGKTSLLGFAAAKARQRGTAVLTVVGVESEALLAFAGIADLLRPLREYMGRLPVTQRQALEVCLALSDGPAHGPLAACAGTLGVLAAASEDSPLVIVVDDFQWVDAESAQILLFVARRLATEHIVMVLAVREEPDASLPVTNLPVLHLTGLSPAECAELAKRQGIAVARSVLQSLVETTGGNPLAVVEHQRLAMASSGTSDRGTASSEPSALHASLERTWGRLVEQMSDESRTALFVGAADHETKGHYAARALDSLGISLGSLEPAERLGLVKCVNGEIHLRHPLLRSVVFARTPLASRVAVYRALADAADGYLRTWYLAAAATGPDEAVAAALMAASSNARERNGFGASARILRRAAELTDGNLLRAERLVQAAHDAQLAGDAHAAVAWCEEALRLRRDPAFVAEVERIAGRARTWMGKPSHAFDSLVRAAAMVRPIDAGRAAQVLAEATAPAAMQGHANLMRQVAEQVEDIWNESVEVAETATATVLVMVAEAFVLSGELHRAEPYLRRAATLLHSNPISEIEGLGFLAQSLTWIERYTDARQYLGALLEAGRRMASPSILSFALTVSAEVGWWTGQWAAAYADATEALQWSEEHAQPGLVGYSLSLLARIEASRGDREVCEAHVGRARREIEPHGVGCLPVYSSAELGLAALSAGDLATAIDNLERAWELSCRERVGNPNVVPMAGDLVEALARAGERDRCRDVTRWLDERAEVTGLAYPRAAAYRARGILAVDVAEAQRWFAESIASLRAGGPIPFEEARTLLCRGEALRRARHPAAARPFLQRALAVFDGLGARAWSARAGAELAASGGKGRHTWPTTGAGGELDRLSPQELQVARAAGRGLNNTEVAAVLFVSRKTVEAHLTRVYRKLAVRSRTELALVLHAHGISDLHTH